MIVLKVKQPYDITLNPTAFEEIRIWEDEDGNSFLTFWSGDNAYSQLAVTREER